MRYNPQHIQALIGLKPKGLKMGILIQAFNYKRLIHCID